MKIIPRRIEKSLLEWIDGKEILVIRGSRQCGKTTLLNRLSEVLKERKIDPKRIHIISFEDDIEKDRFEKDPKGYINFYVANSSEKHFFLLDEVQYIKNAGKILKLLFDTQENIKLIVTGSSSLDLNEMGSFLVGRALFFDMYPLSFEEFLSTKEDDGMLRYYKNNKIDLGSISLPDVLFLDKLNLYLREYILFGGYPAVVLETNTEKKKFLLRNMLLTYIEKDITKIYGPKYKHKILDLIKYLAAINGSIVNYEDACNSTNLYFKEMKTILSILEDTYIIKIIKPFHKNLVTELKKNPKIYFMDTGLRNFIVERFEFNEEEFGKILENHVLSSYRELKINYWRTAAKAEVDFVFPDKNIPIEVKTRPKITRSFKSFLNSYSPKEAIIANMNISEKTNIEMTKVFFIPIAFL